MDKATVIGFVVAISCIVISILLGGSLLAFFDVPSLFIVFGGTIACLLTSYPMTEVKSLVKIIKNAFNEDSSTIKDTIDLLVSLSERARREGILAIEKALQEIDDDYLKGGLRLAVDGSEPDTIKDALEIELENIEIRHKNGQKILDTGGNMAPAYGMIGTLIGLVNMLQNMSDPAAIGPAMAVALLTTLYGAVLANVIFVPLNTKLAFRTEAEMLKKSLVIEGIIGIQGGDNPRMLRSKLETYLPPGERSKEE